MTVLLTAYKGTSSVAQLITVLLIFILVLAMAAFTTKYVGNYQKMQGVNRNMEVIETLRITNNKYIQIVRAANKYIVIAVGKDEISMLTEVDENAIKYASSDNGSFKNSFSDLFGKAVKKFNKEEKDKEEKEE